MGKMFSQKFLTSCIILHTYMHVSNGMQKCFFRVLGFRVYMVSWELKGLGLYGIMGLASYATYIFF
jgi:hypothetical protein